MKRVSFHELIDKNQLVYAENDEPEFDDHLLEKKAPQLLARCLKDNLTKTQKYYIILYYRDNMTITQIAELCGVNRSTVSRTIHRGRARLIKAIRCEALHDVYARK